jgi:chromosomal replication initiation ATPase DnaA
MTDLDPKLTFDSFVVGPANRLATAAARRAAESPGTSYNPLFIYSGSGLGKTHLLIAVAHHTKANSSEADVEYMALERYLEELASALESGTRDAFRDRYGHLDILLLDDVQFLAGQNEAQEMLLRTLDRLSSTGSQIVLASDRPPAEIDGLDARLLSRFSGGLIVDIGAPEFETRVAIVRRKAGERGHELAEGVAEALGRYPFRNVRELGGALNRVLATQDLEGRQVTPREAAALMGDEIGRAAVRGKEGDFERFLDDLAGAVAVTVDAREQPWRKAIQEAIDAAEREGFAAKRLASLRGESELPSWELTVRRFQTDIQRLRDIEYELDHLGNPWPEAAQAVLKDPDRMEEAEALLTSVRERQRPFPRLGDGPRLGDLEVGFPKMAMKAVRQLVAAERPEYNPVYLWSEVPGRGRALLGAAGRAFQRDNPSARMAVTSVKDFAADFIRALGEGVAGAWRERWWTVDLLLVHGIEALSDTERAQDEFFHLFEALKRRGARVLLAADCPPIGVARINERLRSRFEAGLVVEVDSGDAMDDLVLLEVSESIPVGAAWAEPVAAEAAGAIPASTLDDLGFDVTAESGVTDGTLQPVAAREAYVDPGPEVRAARRRGDSGPWFPSGENVVIRWPRIEDLLQEGLD